MPLHNALRAAFMVCNVAAGKDEALSANPVKALLQLRPTAWTAADPQSLATADTGQPFSLSF